MGNTFKKMTEEDQARQWCYDPKLGDTKKGIASPAIRELAAELAKKAGLPCTNPDDYK